MTNLDNLFKLFAQITERYLDVSRQGYTELDAIADVTGLTRTAHDLGNIEADHEELYAWCDGGSEGGGERGPAYASFKITKVNGDDVYWAKRERLLDSTSPEAEYHAFINLLRFLWDDAKNITLTVFVDSQLLQKQLTLQWAVKADNLKPLHKEARGLMEQFEAVQIEWISGDEMKKILGH